MLKKIKLSVIAIILLYSACNETIKSQFNNYDEMIKSGSYLNGWISDVVPKNAFNIYEEHNLDSNVIFIKFNYYGKLNIKNIKLISNNDISKKYEIGMYKYINDKSSFNEKKIEIYNYDDKKISKIMHKGKLIHYENEKLCVYYE